MENKYTRETAKTDDIIKQNEIRVTTQGKMRRYISYATNLFQDNKECDEITLKAMGKAINKTVAIAEIIKRRIPNLHQYTEINTAEIKETHVPNEEGLEVVEITRHVSSILISLSTRTLDIDAIGYQPPIPDTEVRPPTSPRSFTTRGGRRSGRGGGRYQSPNPDSEGRSPGPSGYFPRGRRSGRGGGRRSVRGRSRRPNNRQGPRNDSPNEKQIVETPVVAPISAPTPPSTPATTAPVLSHTEGTYFNTDTVNQENRNEYGYPRGGRGGRGRRGGRTGGFRSRGGYNRGRLLPKQF